METDGTLIESCDTLVGIPEKANILDSVSFFQGMKEVFDAIRPGEELVYNCVQDDVFGYTSYCDFIIRKEQVENDAKMLWLIYDLEEQYLKVLELQQSRNVKSLQKESLSKINQRLQSEISAVKENLLVRKEDKTILIKTDHQYVNVEFDQILYFEAFGDYVKVHTTKKTYVNYNRMKHIEAKVPHDQFIRVHRSYIVRIDKIDNIEQESLQLGDKIIPIGASYKSDLLDKLKQL
jgi:hypothetical protein